MWTYGFEFVLRTDRSSQMHYVLYAGVRARQGRVYGVFHADCIDTRPPY